MISVRHSTLLLLLLYLFYAVIFPMEVAVYPAGYVQERQVSVQSICLYYEGKSGSLFMSVEHR